MRPTAKFRRSICPEDRAGNAGRLAARRARDFNNTRKTFPLGVVFYDNGHYARTQRCTTPTEC